jgi:signal transduction histidine kinase/CheY-like chemotaxis protein/CHASE3 domain sensor protein
MTLLLNMKRNLLIGFGASLLILILSSAASLISIRSLFDSAAQVGHTNTVVQKLQETISIMKDAETGQRGFLLTGKNEFLEPYNGSQEKVKALIGEIRSLTTDNSMQQERIDKFDQLVNRRYAKLQELVDKKRMNDIISLADMQQGKDFMDNARLMITQMASHENGLLAARSKKLSRFTAYTPLLIVAAAVLAILITVLFFIKTNRDITERARLQQALQQKEAAVGNRINIIRKVSDKISAGDYSVRVNDDGLDELGGISGSLNKMAASLEMSFNDLSGKEWLQAGLAGVNQAIIGHDNLQIMAGRLTRFVAEYSGSNTGAFYINENGQQLSLQGSYALSAGAVTIFRMGEGLPGQSAHSKKQLYISGIKAADISINFSAASITPASVVVFPLLFENDVKGVLEMASVRIYSEKELAFFRIIAENIGVAINTVQNRQRMQELLEETQSQSEELMSQQTALEHVNTELETQAQQLQTSEEELKVQSEELIEINSLLEERSLALEQRNQLILHKNAEIEKRAADLAQSTRYKSEFLANMSHELRTPLNSILLLSRLMAENNEKNLHPEQVQYAQVIQSSGNGLLQLIDEILDLSKIESGKMTIEHLPVKVQDITDGLNGLFEPIAREQHLQFQVNIGVEVPENIETDRLRLEQVLKNLLSNAFKFTPEGFIRLSVSCPAGKPGFICFTVRDSGIGISPDKQDIIFEAFQQEDGSTRRKFGGTGLGLSISRQLAKLLGGDITLSSEPGSGSEFVCCIPIKQGVYAPPEQMPVPDNRELSMPPVTETDNRYDTTVIPPEIADDRNSIRTGDKVILIIEDDIKFADALLDYARQKGYKAVVAVRGDRGIEMASVYHPAGILLDIQLPVKNGWQVMEALKSNPHTRHIPVHIMSSYEVKKESLLKGAVDFINKPVAFEQLNTIFEKLEFVLSKKEKKVLIIEENYKHAKALAYYLGTYQVNTEINQSVDASVRSLYKKEVDCVILDMSIADNNTSELLEQIRKNTGLEDLPVILFTGKSLSQPEEFRIKKYADAIVLKTANSYRRILDEVSLFLHLVQEQHARKSAPDFERSVLQENVLKGRRVLLADDDVRNIFSMTRVLEKYEMVVIPAMDGREALQLIQANPVEIVLMDIMMPEMDGYESIRGIRRLPQFKNIPIIAITAKAMSGDRDKCIAAGASDYISKPVDTDQLVSLLRIWLYEKGY